MRAFSYLCGAALGVLVLGACPGKATPETFQTTCQFVGSCLLDGAPEKGYCLERIMFTCDDHAVANDFQSYCQGMTGTYSKDRCPDTPFGCCLPPLSDVAKLECTLAEETQCFYGDFQGKTSQESCELGGGTFLQKPGQGQTPNVCE